jgi:hypothetical protein
LHDICSDIDDPFYFNNFVSVSRKSVFDLELLVRFNRILLVVDRAVGNTIALCKEQDSRIVIINSTSFTDLEWFEYIYRSVYTFDSFSGRIDIHS